MSDQYGELISHNNSRPPPKGTFKSAKREVKEVDEFTSSTTPNSKRRKQQKEEEEEEEEEEEYIPCEEEKVQTVLQRSRVSEYGIT